MKLKNSHNFGRDYKDDRLFFYLLWCNATRERGHGDTWIVRVRKKHSNNQYPESTGISLNRPDPNFYWVEKWYR